jgi:hypothetical protein
MHTVTLVRQEDAASWEETSAMAACVHNVTSAGRQRQPFVHYY